MDASLLVVGDDAFLSAFNARVEKQYEWAIASVSTAEAALSLLPKQKPDLLVLQASQRGSLNLCQQLKAQKTLSWIFCLLLDNRPRPDSEPAHAEGYWDIEIAANALEKGADAYLWMTPDQFAVAQVLRKQERLLRAQLEVGIRQVQSYRELMQSNDLLSAIALTDPLTELSNRRALEWELPRQIQSARARNAPLSLLILDIDYFKPINDTHGHLVGDRALQLLSARLRYNLRTSDAPFRYGGEEFVIILSNTSNREATQIARRLRHIISEQPFTINRNLSINITVSIGTTALTKHDDAEGISLLGRADANLLEAKSSGRNRVVSCYDLPKRPMPLQLSDKSQ